MEHTLPQLTYAQDALAPHISSETMEYHYGKHHQAYVTSIGHINTILSEFQMYSMSQDISIRLKAPTLGCSIHCQA
jgi:Fe-Mn family superoxide dismutase